MAKPPLSWLKPRELEAGSAPVRRPTALPTPRQVALRVRQGGHDVPVDVIIRIVCRFQPDSAPVGRVAGLDVLIDRKAAAGDRTEPDLMVTYWLRAVRES